MNVRQSHDLNDDDRDNASRGMNDMETQTKLFEWNEKMPTSYTSSDTIPDTRALAHEKVKPHKKHLRIRLLKDFAQMEFGADQWVLEHGMPPSMVLSVRPRVTDLKKAGLLMRTKYGLTLDGNKQQMFTLYPFYKTRLETLAAQFGMDAGAEALLAEVGL